MVSRLNPYLNFRNSAREAITFYQSVFGGELTTDSGYTIMAADVPAHMQLTEGSSMSISLSGDDEAELTGYWEKLIEGGTVVEPLSKAPWGDSFGMAVDRFGIQWLVNIAGAPQG